jgi:DNA polymerase-4
LSVAVTLVGLEAAGSITGELMQSRDRTKRVSAVLDSINRKYGNNSLYFGAMHQAIDQDAAPMRIPFAHVPETALEEEAPSRRREAARSVAAKAEELYLLRERQFKVMAENAHRESQKRRAGTPATAPSAAFKAGAGGWSSAPKSGPEPEIGQTGSLF